MKIDTSFDFRTDSNGRDPDHASPTLRAYHQNLWSKPLPSGEVLRLEMKPGEYLSAIAGSQQFHLTSDAISNSLSGHKAVQHYIKQVPPVIVREVKDLGSTIGSRILFPGDMVDGKRTINASRGLHPKVRDRFDLTLECIRLHYQGGTSPLSQTLLRYKVFFELFSNFEGYVEFFLLQDLLLNGKVVYFNSIQSPFISSPYPASSKEYQTYLERTVEFLRSRNSRIQAAQWD